MSTSNSHISPVLDVDRMSLITIENDVDDAGISANDIVVTTIGTGYTNVAPSVYIATISAPDRATGATANANVHIEVTLPIATSGTVKLESPNTGYVVTALNSGQFVIGEGVRTVANNPSGTQAGSQTSAANNGQTTALVNAAIGIVTCLLYTSDAADE